MSSEFYKQKRRQRRRNHIAKDLREPKYRQRIEDNKKHEYSRQDFKRFGLEDE